MRLHAIGFPCEMDRATSEFILGTVAASRRRLVTAAGEYRIWRSRSGAEIWLQFPSAVRNISSTGRTAPVSAPGKSGAPGAPVTDAERLAGMSVSHAGSNSVEITLGRLHATAPGNPLDGAAIGLIGSRRPDDKPIALSFELLNFAATRMTKPRRVRVHLTGIAQRIWAYANERAYMLETPEDRLIATGAMAGLDPGDLKSLSLVYRPKPGCLWLMTGVVKRSTRLVNEITRKPYYLVELETDRGVVDVVANPDSIEGDISTGHILQALVLLSGQIIADTP